MTVTGLEAFDSTVQKTNLWLKDIMIELNTDDRHHAMIALRAVLHTVRDRLMLSEAVELGAQLPLLVRGIYFEGWHPAKKQLKERHKDQFFAHVTHYFRNEPDVDAEKVVRAVFKVLAHRISEGEIEDVKHLLPVELRELWPEPIVAAG
ncbi:MAG: hypothetical protein A2219_05235 [Elusimicrobia bacterium RIFOXYA2_FULL_50_26]|nr:MAG: hypothetical protein A2219_05235 [Elusimicrobia bacterium RIFOXYA2_FULL_50_26]OGS24264.1 MAG: hypothetical protein A2314_03395 [Elusimicrobia bacterium RIFOXYB2_FULL_50_12]